MFRQAVLVLSCSEADCVLRPSGAQCHQVADPRGLPALTGGGAGKTRRLNTPLADGDQVLGWDSSIRRAGTAAQPPERCSTARLLPPGDGRARTLSGAVRSAPRTTGPGRNRSGGRAVNGPRRGRTTSPPEILPAARPVKRPACSGARDDGHVDSGADPSSGRRRRGWSGRRSLSQSARQRRVVRSPSRAMCAPRRRGCPGATSGASDGRCRARPGT